MRLFNSHLTDDSTNTTFGSALQLISKTMKQGENLTGLEINDEGTNDGGVEVSQKSIVKQAPNFLKYDALTNFYSSIYPNTPERDLYEIHEGESMPGKESTCYKAGFEPVEKQQINELVLPQYAINHYSTRIGGAIFGLSTSQRNVNATITHGRQSIFNPYVYINDYTGVYKDTIHFRDTAFDKSKEILRMCSENPTIKNLVEHPVGSSRYFYEDFAYCAELGKLSNNHLITLRKFPTPINDNIFLGSSSTVPLDEYDEYYLKPEFPADMGRMVCWFGGDDNRLEEIINMSFHASWKDMKGDWQEVDTGTDNESSGMLGIISNAQSAAYRRGFMAGTNSGAGLGKIIGRHARNRLSDKYRTKAYKQYDKNKIYTPKDIIRDTKYYEGIMSFSNKITLTFRYKMRSFNDINQKIAFLDLIANILNVTYRKATWWGGGVNWVGTPQSQRPFKIANAMIDKAFDKAGGLWNTLFSGESFFNFHEFANSFSDMVNALWESIKDAVNTITGAGKSKSEKVERFHNWVKAGGAFISDLGRGALKNALGRPQVYALNSILDGSATGMWHLTIGNPFNPIVSMGNMIISDVQMFQKGALTIDDFPEELVVKITLEHGKPRDITAISKMYTRGYGEIYSSVGNQNKVNTTNKKEKTKGKKAASSRRKHKEK